MQITISNYNNIRNLDYEIEDSKINFLFGISGCGKSSIAKALTKKSSEDNIPYNTENIPFVEVNQGSITFNEYEMFDLDYMKRVLIEKQDGTDIYHIMIGNNGELNALKEEYNKYIESLLMQRENIFNISKDLSKNIKEKSEGAKEVIRNIISNLKESDENSSQILNIMKNSINDLKLFNKINDQYYCLDVPINFKENEYPCKLIIKDDRKEGKSIDSSNFKVAISVKTVKLGTVDALLNVKNRNIDLQLKCDKSVMNLFVISKEKLKEIVESSGFSTKIEIVERTEELQLSSCREFFNDNNIKSITLYYRISTLTAFIFTLFSLLLFPTSLFFLTLKVIFVFIYLYLSYTKLFKYKIEEGLVGILASLLLLVIMFRY